MHDICIFRTEWICFPACFIKRFHVGMIYQAYGTVAYSHLILMTPFLSSNGNDGGSGTISCCEGLKIPVTCWSKRIQYKKGRENNSAAQKDKADSRCICIRVYLHEDVHINASDRCECNAKEPRSRWRARSNENTLLKPSAEWRRAVC